MRVDVVLRYVGVVMLFIAGFMLLSAGISCLNGVDSAFYPLLLSALLTTLLGAFPLIFVSKRDQITNKEGFCIVVGSWLLSCVVGMFPYLIWGGEFSLVNAWFESVSGFTTTGASVLTDVEALPRGLQFWRFSTTWIGGMGVFVFIMSILPLMGGSTINLMKAESPGPSVSRLVPHIKDTAKILYGIYLAITLLEIVILCALGMPLFESLLTSFGTTGTGGFGFRNDSFASFSPAIQNTVTTFMILSGINYTFYFCILSRRIKDAFRIEEVRWYLFLIFASVGMITYNIRPLYANTRDALRNAFFQVGAIITTTGYSTADFDMWPALSQTILVTLMFVGACAGSTGGGMKVSRLVILFKTIRKELSLIIHPREIRKIRMDGHVVEHSTLRSTNVFLVIYFILLMLSTLIISLDEFDFTTNFTAVVSCLNNIGPGLNRVGPAQNFSIFSPLSKVVLIFDMLAGRLEIFPMLVLFSRSTWRHK